MVQVKHRDLPGKWGFADKLETWTERRMVHMAGQLLERYRVKRSRANLEQMQMMRRQLFFKPDLGGR